MIRLIISNYRDILFNTARIFASVFEILLSYMLANNFFTPKIKNKNFDFIPFFALAAGVILFQEYRDPGNWKYVFECAALIAVLFTLYEGKLKTKVIGSVTFVLLIAASVILAAFAFAFIGGKTDLSDDAASPFVSLLKLTLSKIFMVLGAILISIIAKSNPRTETSFRLWMALLTVPAVTLVTFSVYQYYIENYPRDESIQGYIYISCIGLLFINLLVFILFRRMQKQLGIRRDTDILTSQLAMQESSISNLENAYNRTRSFRHDIKNHILLMNMLAEQGKYDELKNYLKDMSGVIDESSYVRISGISAVDAILNEKLYEAQSRSITTSYDVVNLDKNNIKPLDMCIILSNALDNAIEANSRIEDKDARYVKLKIHGNETFSVISVSNPTAEEPKKLGGNLFATSKEDSDNHGFGLKSIENTAGKYKGEMLCKCEDGVFTLVVRLNSPTKISGQEPQK